MTNRKEVRGKEKEELGRAGWYPLFAPVLANYALVCGDDDVVANKPCHLSASYTERNETIALEVRGCSLFFEFWVGRERRHRGRHRGKTEEDTRKTSPFISSLFLYSVPVSLNSRKILHS